MRSVASFVSHAWSAASFPRSSSRTSEGPLKGIALWTALAGEGLLAPLRWLAAHHRPWEIPNRRAVDERVRYRAYIRVESIAEAAARHGHKEVIEWLDEQDCVWKHDYLRMAENPRIMVAAAGGGQCELVEWLMNGPCMYYAPAYEIEAIEAAAGGGHLKVLSYLYPKCSSRGFLRREAFHVAATGGHLEVLIWLHEHGCPWSSTACIGAARGGHLPVLRWLLCERRGAFRLLGCARVAAEEGDLAVLQWLNEQGPLPYASICASAAKGGHLAVLQWLRRNGYPWDRSTPLEAACHGRLGCLEWALDNGCKWNAKECLYRAKCEGHGNVMDWIRERMELAHVS